MAIVLIILTHNILVCFNLNLLLHGASINRQTLLMMSFVINLEGSLTELDQLCHSVHHCKTHHLALREKERERDGERE